MTQDTVGSETSPLEGSHRFACFMEISLLNSYLLQSYGPVSKIQDTTHPDTRSDIKNTKNTIEYVLLETFQCIKQYQF